MQTSVIEKGDHKSIQEIPSTAEIVRKISKGPISDRRVAFFGLRRPLLVFDCLANGWRRFWVLGRSYPQTRQKRRHPFGRQRTTRGGAVQIRSSRPLSPEVATLARFRRTFQGQVTTSDTLTAGIIMSTR